MFRYVLLVKLYDDTSNIVEINIDANHLINIYNNSVTT